MVSSRSLGAAMLLVALAVPAAAQDAPKEPRRIRAGVGPQVVPRYPGSDEYALRPLISVALSRGDRPFDFSAPDQSFGPALVRSGDFQFGPAINLEGKRKSSDTNGILPPLGRTVEVGGHVQFNLTPAVRFRSELRQGIGGHKGTIGTLAADYVARDGDAWLFSVGPRATFVTAKYNRAYFGLDPVNAARLGTAAYSPGGGLQTVGAASTFIYQFSPQWGIAGYAKYDRLVNDAADSPVVRRFGSRDQISGGAALTYTFFVRRR